MTFLNSLPCSNCKNFAGIKQKEKREETEYIGCKIAKDGNAKNLLLVTKIHSSCKKQEPIYDEVLGNG